MDPVLTPGALTVLERRYLARDEAGRVRETPDELFRRVARVVAAPDEQYGDDPRAAEERFYGRMARLELLPNSPALMNAGRELGQLAACFVVPVGDSMEEIFEAVKWAAVIQMTGGGTGFSFSRLRPAGDLVSSTRGAASGPLPFMDVFNSATDAIKQGGTRRGANMGVLRVDHPDILDFITAKLDRTRLTNFNVSVAVTDEFMAAVADGGDYALVSPRTGAEVKRLDARRVFRLMVNAAWASGDPGVIFIDRINAAQPTPSMGEIESTNPCLTGDARVLVHGRGFVPIRELVGEQVRVATATPGGVCLRPTSRIARTGVKPVFRLATVEGMELRLTHDHVVATDRGDVRAADLEPGDRIPLLLPSAPAVRWDSPDARFGELIGWLTGDGHFTGHEHDEPTVVLSFFGTDKLEAAPRLLEAARELSGDERLSLEQVGARDVAYVRSRRLLDALADRGVTADCKRLVPEMVLRGSPDLQSGYVRGLFSSDGSVQASVRLASNEPSLLRGVQLLLLRLGVRSVLCANRRVASVRRLPDGRGGLREVPCVAQHELAVSAASLPPFAGSVGFLLAHKQERLRSMVAATVRGPYRARPWATVADVVPAGEEEVFDLTEPVTSHFFANGLLVHNCGEQPLLPFESCVLASINVAKFVRSDKDGNAIDWPRLRDAVHDGVHFLDNIIDANRYPLPQIERITRANRKIGLGVMGFADMLILLGVPYDAPRALVIADEVAAFLERESRAASAELARRRGPFPAFETSRWSERGSPPLRNATTTTVAPTGTISIIAGCSSGIEPLYAVSYVRHVLDGARLSEAHPLFRQLAEERGIYTDALRDRIAERGRVRGLPDVPADLQALFPTAHDLSPETHVRMQAAFQRHVHAAVSKTVNFPANATPDDVAAAYRLAFDLGCKGVTVYRDRSRQTQVLRYGPEATDDDDADPMCPECGGPLVVAGGCAACRTCGWSKCG